MDAAQDTFREVISGDPDPNSIDSQINQTTALTYWTSVEPTVDGMLGGYPQVSRVDLQGSRTFISKLRRLDRVSHSDSSTTTTSTSTTEDSLKARPIERALEGGAGIGRITKGLLLNLAQEIDIVEPLSKFAATLRTDADILESGRLRDVYVCGLENWVPAEGRRYDLIWNQWCLGHLTDLQLAHYLRSCANTLRRVPAKAIAATESEQRMDDTEHQAEMVTGWIVVKENLSTHPDFPVDSQQDVFDEEDSSVTRSDVSFRRVFEEAGLKVVRFEVQKGMPKVLYPVGMYALRPK